MEVGKQLIISCLRDTANPHKHINSAVKKEDTFSF